MIIKNIKWSIDETFGRKLPTEVEISDILIKDHFPRQTDQTDEEYTAFVNDCLPEFVSDVYGYGIDHQGYDIVRPFNPKTKVWKIPVSWEECGVVSIEAETLGDAIEYVKEDINDIPLPDGDYIDGSFKIDSEDEDYIKEFFN